MKRKTYRIKTACPQCGCSGLTVFKKRPIPQTQGGLPAGKTLRCRPENTG